MQITHSVEPLDAIAYYPHKNGKADVYLRENITQEEVELPNGKTQIQYSADEVHFKTSLSQQEVEDNFDELWVKAETDSRPVEDRLEEMEELIGLLTDVVLEVE